MLNHHDPHHNHQCRQHYRHRYRHRHFHYSFLVHACSEGFPRCFLKRGVVAASSLSIRSDPHKLHLSMNDLHHHTHHSSHTLSNRPMLLSQCPPTLPPATDGRAPLPFQPTSRPLLLLRLRGQHGRCRPGRAWGDAPRRVPTVRPATLPPPPSHSSTICCCRADMASGGVPASSCHLAPRRVVAGGPGGTPAGVHVPGVRRGGAPLCEHRTPRPGDQAFALGCAAPNRGEGRRAADPGSPGRFFYPIFSPRKMGTVVCV